MRNNSLKTPLHLASRFGHTDIARILLQESACSINLIDNHQHTPLFAAVKHGSIPMIKLLIESGANPMAQSSDKKIPLDLAIHNGNIDVVRLLLDELKEDADEYRKVFPLHDAVNKQQIKVMKLVLKKKYAQIDQIDDHGQTCFDLAIDINFIDGVKLLLEHDDWEKVVRRRYSELDEHLKSPMQNLIEKMPDMAKIVMDKSILRAGTTIYHNYEFLDDTYVLKPENYDYNEKKIFSSKFLYKNFCQCFIFS